MEFGKASEGHYVTFLCSPPTPGVSARETMDLPQSKEKIRGTVWVELDDEVVSTVDDAAAGIDHDTKTTTASPLTTIKSTISGNDTTLKVLSGSYNNNQGKLPSTAYSSTNATSSISSTRSIKEKERR